MAAAACPTWSWARWTSVTASTTAPTLARCRARPAPRPPRSRPRTRPRRSASPPRRTARRAAPPGPCPSTPAWPAPGAGPAAGPRPRTRAVPSPAPPTWPARTARRPAAGPPRGARRSAAAARPTAARRRPETNALSGSTASGGKITARITTIPSGPDQDLDDQEDLARAVPEQPEVLLQQVELGQVGGPLQVVDPADRVELLGDAHRQVKDVRSDRTAPAVPASMASAQDTVYRTATRITPRERRGAVLQRGVDDQREADRVQHRADRVPDQQGRRYTTASRARPAIPSRAPTARPPAHGPVSRPGVRSGPKPGAKRS